ncbi:hypothetical protein [Streptomyces lydicus]|uniref:hypothetical protein n=1 Tax=Streptomyces lydicus TaxID=47763 RepID=UPI00131D20BC|nr:hypothetical protein [Streptomyces lydicus]
MANAFWRLVDWSSAKGEKPASSQVPRWSAGDVAGRAKDAVADFLRSFHARVAGVGDTDERADARPQLVSSHLQGAFRVWLAGQGEVEAAGLEAEQLRQQVPVVDVEAVRGILVGARAAVDADPGEALQ